MGVVRIDIDSALANADDQIFAVPIAVVAGNPVLPRHQVEVVRLRVIRAALLDRTFLARQQIHFQRIDNGFRNFILDVEDIS